MMEARPSIDRIARLASVARGLEREGFYNGAKLLRAVLDGELTRLADHDAPTGPDAAAMAVDALRVELVTAGTEREVVDRLAAVARIVRERGTVTLDDVPSARSCRVCGRLFLGDHVPAACPTCEAPGISFREHLPIWFLEHTEPGTVLAALATGPSRVRAAIGHRSDAELDRRPALSEWSAREVLEHLVHAETLLATRVPRLLDEDDPELVAWAVGSGAPPSDEASDDSQSTASDLARHQAALRERTLERLLGLDEAGWGRQGRHPEWGRVTVLSQAAYFARHEASHLAQLVAAAEGRLPGTREHALV